MKTRIIILLWFCVWWAFSGYAQNPSSPVTETGNAAVTYEGTSFSTQFIVGSAYLSDTARITANNIRTRTGFPYGVLYRKNTFSDATFIVSKGYYGDKINISWQIESNKEYIKSFSIYRKLLQDNDDAYKLIKTLGNSDYSYDDLYLEAGVLYEYMVVADSVSTLNQRYLDYMEGVGFRNPTAVVTGKITFEGGSPVQDVMLYAESQGNTDSTTTKSLDLKEKRKLHIKNVNNLAISDELTIQAWLKVKAGIGGKLINADNNTTIIFTADNNSMKFSVSANGASDSCKISNSYPTGKTDAFGNDVFEAIEGIDKFVHLSVVLSKSKPIQYYINGRNISQAYISNPKNVYPTGKSAVLALQTATYPGNTTIVNNIWIGDTYNGGSFRQIDEYRLWTRALTDEEIRRDYRKIISGGEKALKVYLRFDEGYGTETYDLSKEGYNFNNNNAILKLANGTLPPIKNDFFSSDKPSGDQLGVFGITDVDGSYVISAIPYQGDGETYKVTPSLGVHKFEPATQTVYLGKGSEVINQLNFKDISSFKFRGQAVFNVQNVFPSVDTVDLTSKQIKEFGYNQYLVNSTDLYEKGQYQYEGGTKNADGTLTGGLFIKYPKLGVEKAEIYVDGRVVFDQNNQPILTKADGTFEVQVPIGKHRIEVKKHGHTFVHNGRFPADENELFDFYQDQTATRTFADSTRIAVVGRVVGGSVQFDKEIGFGYDGEYSYLSPKTGTVEIISSQNNIGIANILLKGSKDDNALDHLITTDSITGEYRALLVPYKYEILQSGIKLKNNDKISILSTGETLDFREVPETKQSNYTTKDKTTEISLPYHYVKSF